MEDSWERLEALKVYNSTFKGQNLSTLIHTVI